MTQTLAEFFRERKLRTEQENAGIDWARRKADWLEALSHLYGMIEQFVAEPRAQGALTLSRRPLEITESHLGTYAAEELVLTVGDEEVVFSPKGRNVVGVQGRVDVRGEAGEATLVLQPGPRWQFMLSRQPTLRLAELNLDTFGDMLVRIMRR